MRTQTCTVTRHDSTSIGGRWSGFTVDAVGGKPRIKLKCREARKWAGERCIMCTEGAFIQLTLRLGFGRSFLLQPHPPHAAEGATGRTGIRSASIVYLYRPVTNISFAALGRQKPKDRGRRSTMRAAFPHSSNPGHRDREPDSSRCRSPLQIGREITRFLRPSSHPTRTQLRAGCEARVGAGKRAGVGHRMQLSRTCVAACCCPGRNGTAACVGVPRACALPLRTRSCWMGARLGDRGWGLGPGLGMCRARFKQNLPFHWP